MSLSRTALRIAACRALRGATIAESRVFDSRIGEIAFDDPNDRLPLVIVTTDDELIGPIDGLNIIGAPSTLDLVFDLSIASTVTLEAGQVDIAIGQTDASLELALDILSRQVIRTLQTSTAPWADLFRDLCLNVENVTARRGADETKGVRFAARQIVVPVMPLGDPLYTPAVGTPIARFLALCDQSSDLATVAAAFRNQLSDAPASPVLDRAVLGLSADVADRIGLDIPGPQPPPAPTLFIDGQAATGGEAALLPETP